MSLSKSKVKSKIKELNEKLKLYNHHYYNKNESLVSDEYYDAKLLELENIRDNFPEEYNQVFQKDFSKSVLEKVNHLDEQDVKLQKEKHQKLMLSLNKAYSFEDLERYTNRINTFVGNNHQYILQEKIDGVSISLYYENGILTKALTRGDGIYGENVTHNALNIKDIPKTINIKENIELRGEIFFSLKLFESLKNEFLDKQDGTKNKKWNTPRNKASGILKSLKTTDESSWLSCFIYEVVSPENFNLKTQKQLFDFLKIQGFNLPKFEFIENENLIENFITNFKFEDDQRDYEIDGLVIKLNDLSLYDLLGKTSKFFHHSIAYKFRKKFVMTKIEDIFVTVGRTGLITYNAKLQEVVLNGSKIKASTLHNYEYIKNIKINIGDKVYIEKAGEIIPRVVKLVSPKNDQNYFSPIEFCPSCKNKLSWSENMLNQFCLNPDCIEKKIQKLKYFVSKDGMEIQELGGKKIELFFAKGWVKKIEDIYNLKNNYDDLLKLENFQEHSVNVLLHKIEESKDVYTWKLIAALGIKNIGKKLAKSLVKIIFENDQKNLLSLLEFNYDELEKYDEFGSVKIESLKEFFANDENKNLIKFLSENGFEVKLEKEIIQSTKLENKTFLITGTLEKPRDFYKNLIVQNGGIISSSISKKLDYLIVGQNPGSKEKKAIELNIKIIDEEFLKKMLE
ncbi:NAD-dependent DNA ligase LigA [Mycoplasmopsis pulmonis]|uniref:NAD-dependent DNA ligase LigA n=1 Tax=Mycoplasmopsis pulmonis TaxID=2107 RepID=UPI0010051702|nr:NAD-dependent DNA ligase LigA [Mycoplasmopsis pulmonis]VEU68152.1 NAD(+)-dependent DNA ligase [Mycoplasmopsis pulmonis]